MKNSIVKLFLTGIVIIHFGCSVDNNNACPECFTPPEPFWFEIIDKESNENSFTSNIYDTDEIFVINETGTDDVTYDFIDESDVNLIRITSLGWITEQVTLSIQVSDRELFKLYVDSERLSDDCCSFTVFNEVTVQNTDYEYEPSEGVYKVYIE